MYSDDISLRMAKKCWVISLFCPQDFRMELAVSVNVNFIWSIYSNKRRRLLSYSSRDLRIKTTHYYQYFLFTTLSFIVMRQGERLNLRTSFGDLKFSSLLNDEGGASNCSTSKTSFLSRKYSG